jgi:two-component system cell cycle response regulator DivK
LLQDKSESEYCIDLRFEGSYMQKKILIAEDTEDSRQILKFLLEMDGYAVIEAVDGSEAVKTAAELHPDLILMDISMPIMDGLSATKAIREFNDTDKIPIIAVTAHGKEFFNRAIEAGCNALISKPVDFDTLQPVIRQYLAN